ncbi:hypothetical protein [Kitasatospora sp. NPDC005856]|uniref:hypothetical protein n=1 Tax=Kitasatospora sp. NPDC005856 TaxID=3154566 RepID=UPI0033E5332F
MFDDGEFGGGEGDGVGLLQGWLPTSSEGLRKFLILFTTLILTLVVFSAIRPNRRD